MSKRKNRRKAAYEKQEQRTKMAKKGFDLIEVIKTHKIKSAIAATLAVVLIVVGIVLITSDTKKVIGEESAFDVPVTIAPVETTVPSIQPITPAPSATTVPEVTVAPTTEPLTGEGDESSEEVFDDADGSDPIKAVFTPTIELVEEIPVPFSGTLSYGDDDSAVATVQERLMELDYMDNDEPTEHFGPMTRDAIVIFQRRNNLDTTGKVNAKLYQLLMSADALSYMVVEGDDGDDVYQLQERLYEMGYIAVSPTGHFGEQTRKAVKAFQKNNDITADGKIGTETREKLYSADAIPNYWSYGDSSDEIIPYQKKLKTLGYLTTEPDGNYGSNTIAAVKRFQERNGIIADGYLGPDTVKVLMSSDAIPNSLSIGANGDDVYAAQERLHKLKYLSSDAVTGYFGSITDYAVRAFQKRNDLTVDGRIGKTTMALLMSSDAKAAPSDYVQYDPDDDNGGSGNNNNNNDNNDNDNDNNNNGPSVSKFISVAKSKLGCRYVTGGKGPNTFDCSGLVYYCLNQAGVHQSYLTSYNWRSVTKYQRINDIDDLKKGDVIVFYGHVAIAISSSEMIDASSSRGCVVRRGCLSNWCRSEFICAYRVFG